MSDISRRDFFKMFGLGAKSSPLADDSQPAMTSGNDLPSFNTGPLITGRVKETTSVCTLCGCDCGLIISSIENRIVSIEGDPDNPNNEGFICCKGVALGDDIIVDYN